MSDKNLPALPTGVANLPVLTQDLSEIKSVLEENLGAAQLSANDLDKVKVPSGDVPMWMVQTLNGPQGVAELEGVICMVQNSRTFWIDKNMGNKPPDCSSEDLLRGFGKRGDSDEHDGPHDCSGCAMNQFGSAVSDKGAPAAGKACNERAHLFLLCGSGYLPIVVQIPSTSLPAWKKYIARLSGFGKSYRAVVTKLALAPKKNKGGTAYMEIVFTSAGELPPDAVLRVKEYSTAFAESFKRATRENYEGAPGSETPPPPYEDAPPYSDDDLQPTEQE